MLFIWIIDQIRLIGELADSPTFTRTFPLSVQAKEENQFSSITQSITIHVLIVTRTPREVWRFNNCLTITTVNRITIIVYITQNFEIDRFLLRSVTLRGKLCVFFRSNKKLEKFLRPPRIFLVHRSNIHLWRIQLRTEDGNGDRLSFVSKLFHSFLRSFSSTSSIMKKPRDSTIQ